MSAPSPGELKAAALELLSAGGDERAVEVLRHADVTVDAAVTSWQSSHGPVEGHGVSLAVDAGWLGRLRATPHVLDELHAALARAIAGRPGEALDSLDVCWDRERVGASPVGYRDAPPPGPTSLADALAAYLDARGEAAVARALTAGPVETVATRVDFTPAASDAAMFDEPRAIDVLEEAVRDLLGPRAQVEIRR